MSVTGCPPARTTAPPGGTGTAFPAFRATAVQRSAATDRGAGSTAMRCALSSTLSAAKRAASVLACISSTVYAGEPKSLTAAK